MKSTAWPRSTSAWPTAHIAWLLPTPGRPKAKHIGRVVEEVAVGELVEAAHQRRRQAAFVERVERFARRQLRGAAQARDAALVPLLRFELEDLEEQRERRLLLRLDEARHHLARGRREREAREQAS